MALVPVRPLYSASATATNGSDIIQVTGNVDCSFMSSGSIVSLGTRQLTDAISGTAPDLSGNSTIKLRRPWSDPTTTAPLLAFMSREGLADAVARLRQIIDAQEGTLQGAFSYMGAWDASSGNFPPAPGEGLGSQMYRVSVAGTMGGRAYRVGEPLYYDQFTSQWRSFFELATAFSSNLLLQADAAAWRSSLGLVPTTSATDATAGRLLKVGDFGLGLAMPISNLNDLTSENYFFTPSHFPSNTPNGYMGGGFRFPAGAGEFPEFFAPVFTANGGSFLPNRPLFFRGGKTKNWSEIYQQENILGTVSQSGGIPTGAIIQHGSNANGQFVRFADGTQICTHKIALSAINIPEGGLFKSEQQFWTYPAAFSNSNDVAGSVNAGNCWVNVCQFSTSTMASTFGWAPVTSSGGFLVNMIAIGRWF